MENAIKEAEWLLAQRRKSSEMIKSYEGRLKDISKRYKLDIDLSNDTVYEAREC